ncbi:hypothetical protein GQ457_03G020470 [Hibiscus cannabinus]
MERDLRRATTHMSGMDEPIAFPVCGCGFPAQLKTSWSNDNPGRRFFYCKNHGSLVYRIFGELLVLIELCDQYGICGFVAVSDDCGLMVVVWKLCFLGN